MAKQDSDKLLGTALSWLLPPVSAAAAILATFCVRAERRGDWYVAQGTLGVTLVLLFLMGWAVLGWWQQHYQAAAKPSLSPEFKTYAKVLHLLLRFVGVGIFAVMVNANSYEHWKYGIVARALSVGILLAGAAFIIGALVGFLFGFPPSPTLSQSSSKNESIEKMPSGPKDATAFYDNTNLREISDWLTKVIVGASLVSLSKLPPLLSQLGTFIATGVNPHDPSPPVALALLGYFSSCGILYGYLWTKYEVAATSQRSNVDALGSTAVDGWLHRPPAPNDDPGPMMDAIKAASSAARVRIFLETERYRAPSTEDANERALPVLQALVEADTQEIFHRNRGQYALALMGRKKDPSDVPTSKDDWSKAQDQLTDAIRIRDMSREPNWREYEVARAVCKIHLQLEFNEKQDPGSIDRDLDQAKDFVPPEQLKLIDKDDSITTKDGKKVSAITAWSLEAQR
jgi:hypothetical protein